MGEMATDAIATMEEPKEETKNLNETSEAAEKPAAERRRRLRTKISAPVRVRVNSGPLQHAEVCTTVDASRDGLLFTTSRTDYKDGMDLAITFPYSGASGGVQHERTAVVARVFEMPEGRLGVGIRYYEGKKPELKGGDLKTAKSPKNAGAVARDLEKPMPLVLAVEADQRARETIRTVLTSEGYAVEVVETGAAAVEFLRQRTPNLLLTEIEISDMSGYDLCLIVKSNERLQHVPVVMTTRAGQPNDYSTAHALGAIVCMSKPYKQERLLHVVRMLAPPAVSEEPPAMPHPAKRYRPQMHTSHRASARK